jgi:hypothetical protein
VIEKMFLHGWARRARALLMPIELLVYALPVSVVLPFAILLLRRLPMDDPRRKRLQAILATLAATVAIWMLDGNDNPRYEYVMLPLLGPVVGMVWSARDRRQVGFNQAIVGVCVLICGAAGLILLKLPRVGTGHMAMQVVGFGVSVVLVAFLVAAFAWAEELAAKAASPVVVLLLVLFSLPMGERKNAERRKKSASNASGTLRMVIGNSPQVLAAGVVRDLPELFYYANVDAESYGEFGLLKLAATGGGHWVVLEEKELNPIVKQIRGAFPKGFKRLPMPDPVDRIYVGWYDPPVDANTKLDWKPEKQVEPDE